MARFQFGKYLFRRNCSLSIELHGVVGWQHLALQPAVNGSVAFLQGYGLPIAAGASLFGFVFAGLSPGLDFKLDGMHWKGLVLYMALVAAGCVAMRVVSAMSEGRAKAQLRNSGRR